MSQNERYPAKTTPELWEMLKPLARQMRHTPTPAEEKLWERLRNRQINNLKFRRQHAIERFIVDFYCAEMQLIIEVDGSIHQYTQEEDAVRQEYLETLGLRVLRFSNDDVLTDVEKVAQNIMGIAKKSPSPSNGEGLG